MSEADLKDAKGKSKMVESEQPLKKKNQLELDEEVAKQLQAEMEKEEKLQSEKDRELALEMAKKLNEEYQKSMKTAVEAKKIPVKASKQRMLVKKQKRQPSKTFLANQERRKMINFLKGSIATPTKDKAEDTKEENVTVEAKSAKRVKTIASKKQSKKPRIEESEREAESSILPSAEPEQNPEPSVADHTEQPSQSAQQTSQSEEHVGLYMTLIEPVQAVPISVKAQEVIFWDILRENRKEYFRLKRVGDVFEVYSTWVKVIRSCSRANLEEMHKVGMKLYEPMMKGTEESHLKIAMEYLCMMFELEKVVHRIKDLHHGYVFKKIDKWILFENCGVYMITIDNCYHEYYLVDKVYDHSKEKLNGMLKAKLVCAKESEMAKIVGLVLLVVSTAKGLLLLTSLILLRCLILMKKINVAYEMKTHYGMKTVV
ncbi:hypothetical protein L6452_34358 [Arctium lappa]|uniref:Uncharacterized protein n=1 Tax=Arctium lappa TaxID=4217 RepID=A0ACB8YH95_ARCLA|nr:hypothetical protein L6452_34358 [Arctium lappa]